LVRDGREALIYGVDRRTATTQGEAALVVPHVADPVMLERVVAALLGLDRPAHAPDEHLYLPADTLDRRTFAPVRGAR